MLIKYIQEGGVIELDSRYLEIARKIKLTNTSLPFEVNQTSIFFDEYIVGELVLDDISIKLNPRNNAFNLNNYFQIICFFKNINEELLVGSGFSTGNDLFSFSNLSENFCKFCQKLIQYGLTGTYLEQRDSSFIINGEINFEEFKLQTIPYLGIPLLLNEYSINSQQNQLIKSALLKLIQIEPQDVNPIKFQILRDLISVDDIVFDRDKANIIINSYFSSNPWYVNTLDLSYKILFDLQLEYLNGNLQWMAFLENTNSLFESYVRKILSDNLEENVIKWENPHKFLEMRGMNKIGQKSFSPDILINYSESTGKALAVIDVKNKTFEPKSLKNLDLLCSTNDLYQLIFYCTQLDSKVGALVYPSSTTNPPIELMMDTNSGLKLFLFSINMNHDFGSRSQKLINEVKQYLFREC